MRCPEVEEKPTSYGVARPARSGCYGYNHVEWHCWPDLQRESTANIKSAPAAYIQTSQPKPMRIFEIDCRGLEFTDFKADVTLFLSRGKLRWMIWQGEWMAKGFESTTKFSGVDLQEGEWFDYDEKAGEEVSIKDIKWEITRAWGS